MNGRFLLLLFPAITACARSPRASTPESMTSPMAAGMKQEPTIPGVSERAMRLYRDALVIDTHNDLPLSLIHI